MSSRAVRKRCRNLALAGVDTAGREVKHAAALRSWRKQMDLQRSLQEPGRHRRFRFDDPELGNEFADLSEDSKPPPLVGVGEPFIYQVPDTDP